MLNALEDPLEQPYANFRFRRKSEVEGIRDTGSRRMSVQLGFGGRDWETLQVEIARPEADEIELVPVTVSISNRGLQAPERVACLSLR